jgi:hypothetical protein
MTPSVNRLIARFILHPLIWLANEMNETANGFLNLALTEERSNPLHWFYRGCGAAMVYSFSALLEPMRELAAWNDRQIVRAKEANNDS